MIATLFTCALSIAPFNYEIRSKVLIGERLFVFFDDAKMTLKKSDSFIIDNKALEVVKKDRKSAILKYAPSIHGLKISIHYFNKNFTVTHNTSSTTVLKEQGECDTKLE